MMIFTEADLLANMLYNGGNKIHFYVTFEDLMLVKQGSLDQ